MNRQPLINWEALEELIMPPRPPAGRAAPPGAPGRGIGGWDNQADFYNKMASMETDGTRRQLDCLEITGKDTVLDVGCGPGRLAVPLAERAAQVTALDASPRMLEYCRQNAARAGRTNIETLLCDWEDEEAVAALPQHDIVIASRSIAMRDVERLSSLARKWVVQIIWSHGYPSIPELVGELFAGAEKENDKPFRPVFPRRDRRFGNNLRYNKIYDLGYEPNLRLVDDGFIRHYRSRKEAYADLAGLSSRLDPAGTEVFHANVDRFLTAEPDGGVTFEMRTKTMVLFWQPHRAEENSGACDE